MSLYELIKKQSQQKNRPLKIILDWDECIMPSKPFLLWELSPKNISFSEYFNRFWEKANLEYSNSAFGSKERIYHATYSYVDPDDPNEIMNKKMKSEEAKKQQKAIYESSNLYERQPFLSITEEILKSLKENLISELIVMTAHKKGTQPPEGKPEKRQKFKKTFGKFPNCRWDSTEVAPDPKEKGKFLPYRWEYIKKKYSDFDIFIDDNNSILSETRKHFPNKCYVLPDYRCNRDTQASNIYHVKTTVSELKDEDFVKAAEEYKQKQAAGKLASRSTAAPVSERENIWKQPHLYLAFAGGIGTCLLVLGICWLVKRRVKN